MKTCCTPGIVRDVQMKTTVREHCTRLKGHPQLTKVNAGGDTEERGHSDADERQMLGYCGEEYGTAFLNSYQDKHADSSAGHWRT